jgi:small-conductance mechanosensitive channel
MDQVLHRPGAVRSRLHHRIYEELTARAIEIPFPQRVVHLKRTDPEDAVAAAGSES